MSLPIDNCRSIYCRLRIVCGTGFTLMGINDRRMICPDCCKAINEIKDNRKSNWIPDSKGGEPNCRRR